MNKEKDNFDLSASEKQSAFDTTLLALRAIHNDEVNALKQEISALKDKVERLTQDLKNMTESKRKYKESFIRLNRMVGVTYGSNALASVSAPSRPSPRGPKTPVSFGSKTTVQIPVSSSSISSISTAASMNPSLSSATKSLLNSSASTINPENRNRTSNSLMSRGSVPPKQLFNTSSRDDNTSDDDDDDAELPLKNPVRQIPSSHSKASTPKASSSSRPAPAFPQFSTGKKDSNEDEFWEMQRPGMFDSPLKKKPRKAPQQQKCSGVGVVPFTTDSGETKVLLYEPLDESNEKRGFLVDFGGPIDGSGDVFESASKILERETNTALFDSSGALRMCPSVKNDDNGGYVIFFFKVKYQDPKNFEASIPSERKRKYRWVPVSAILDRDESVLRCPLHERMTNAKDFYSLLGTLVV